MSETLLWSNSKPTSNFGEQTITLNESYDNYEYLKFVFNYSTSSSTQRSLIIPKSDMILATTSSSMRYCSPACVDSTSYTRRFGSLTSHSQIKFWNATLINGGGSSGALAIPIAIYGLK